MPFKISLVKSVNGAPEYIRLRTTGYEHHPSIINAIDRAVVKNVEVLAFGEYLDHNDYDLLRKHMDVEHLVNGHDRHTTIIANGRYLINVISHAVSMTAIHNNQETVDMLNETDERKVFFVIGNPASINTGRPTPYLNNKPYPVTLHSHDFLAYVYTRDSDQNDWAFNRDESIRVQNSITEIFPLNEMQAVVESGKQLLVIAKPSWWKGSEHPRGSPCVRRYQWIQNPELMKANENRGAYCVVNKDFSLTRKIEGYPSSKELFLAQDIEEVKNADGQVTKRYVIYQNKFGKPYGIDLVFIYNGKLGCLDTLKEAIKILVESLDLFSTQIKTPTILSKESYTDRNEQIITLPKVRDYDLREEDNGKYCLLIDDTILHMVSVKVMEMVDVVIENQNELWTTTTIYYKIPHRLIPEAELHVKIPEDQQFVNKLKATYALTKDGGSDLAEELLLKAIDECKNTLNDIGSEL